MIQADVVCGREVDENTAQQSGLTVELHGRVYYFCSEQCLGEFERNPEHLHAAGHGHFARHRAERAGESAAGAAVKPWAGELL